MTFRQGPPAEPSTATAFESISLPVAAANGAFGNRNGFAHQFADHHVSQVARLVDQSGIIATLDQWRTADAIQRHAGGRSAVLKIGPDRCDAATLGRKGILITRIAELLQHRLTDESKAILGIDNASGGSFVEWNNRAWRAFHRITVLIDGYETPRRSRLTRGTIRTIEKNRTANAANLTFKQKRLDCFSKSATRNNTAIASPSGAAMHGKDQSASTPPLPKHSLVAHETTAPFVQSNQTPPGTPRRRPP